MKIIITENNKEKMMYHILNRFKKSGEQPTIEPILQIFDVKYHDIDTYYKLIMDYNGGFENSVDIAKKLLLELKDVPFHSQIGDGTLYFTIKRVVLDRHELAVEVECYGELFNMTIYNEEEDQNEVIERITLSDYYDYWDDIGESIEVRDLITSGIDDVLVKEITYKTGIDIFINHLNI